jgi:high-affinity K+ transport system ATPase subunit B
MEASQTLFVLASASQGIKGEAALRAAGIECALVPVPRTVTSLWGVWLRVAAADRAAAETVLAESGMAVAAVHEVERSRTRPDGVRKETR